MSRKRIQQALEKTLLQNRPMHQDLYVYELEELCEEFFISLIRDNDAFLFAVTENNNHVAMVLLEPSGAVYVNENARTKLREYWPQTYDSNMRQLIPAFIKQLMNNELPINGVKYIK